MKILFFGTPAFAVPVLEALQATHQVVGVVCQPDRPAGRGNRLTAPPVKACALQLGIEVHQPVRLRRDEALLAQVRDEHRPDVLVTAAYGQLFPPAWLRAAPLGALNVHASLLPKGRGAAPIQWALVRGDGSLGVSIMRMDEGMDTGPVLAARGMEAQETDTAATLAPRIAALGAGLLLELLAKPASQWSETPQDAAAASHAPLLTREDGHADFARPAAELFRRWQGFQPWPGLWTHCGGKVLKLAEVRSDEHAQLEPGRLALRGDRVLVGCGAGALHLIAVQEEGGRALDADAWLRGRPRLEGTVLGS